MRNILVVNPKGGCGKTTLATQLAGYFAAQDKKVLLVDRDPQKSSSDWQQTRPPLSKHIDILLLSPDLVLPQEYFQHDYVIQDMPAAWHPKINSPVFDAHTENFLVIPVLPSPTDIKASLRFIMGMYRAGMLEKNNSANPTINAGFVANRTRAQQRYYHILQEFLQRVEIPLITTLRDSQNYIRAMEQGLSIFDLPGNGVKVDLEQWWPLIEWLG